ncbi:hypothetical protein ABEO75_18515, partial [Paenibacillus macerans]|uniref:hypothetical protein n=1 Tax=Paenibacillus macerans TaxID=44252 RepID=UPI003D2950A1
MNDKARVRRAERPLQLALLFSFMQSAGSYRLRAKDGVIPAISGNLGEIEGIYVVIFSNRKEMSIIWVASRVLCKYLLGFEVGYPLGQWISLVFKLQGGSPPLKNFP